MAGSLLFLTKNTNEREYTKVKNNLIQLINKALGPYFKDIYFHDELKNCFLVEFKKDSRNKFFKDNNGNWLVFEGVVFALNETKTYSAEELWNLYKEEDQNFIENLDGHFVIKIYDSKKDTYLVLNDFIKAKTNYYIETSKFILFTPFLITTSVIIKPEIDLDALNEYLWRYYILSYRTIYKDAQRLGPATIYKFEKNELSKTQYWDFPKELTKLTYEQSVDAFVESIQETARLINLEFGKVSSDLTQGQDSRIIVSAFRKQNLPITTTIFGESRFSEVKSVSEIAKRHHLDHHNLILLKEFQDNIWEYFKRSIIIGSGDEPGYLLGRILHMRDQQSKYGNVLLNGAGGPFYKDCFWEEVYALSLYREPGKIDPNQFLKLRPMNKNYKDDFFNQNFLEIKHNSDRYFLDMLEDSIQGYKHLPASMQIDKFALYKWQNYALTGNNISNTVYNSISPLLLRRNLEIGVNMPAKWRWNKSNFQRSVMYQLDPNLAKEKTDFGGINMVPKNSITFIPFYFRYVYRQTERMRNKLLTKFGFKIQTHLQAAWDYIPIYQRLFGHDEIQELLKYSNMNISNVIDKNKWQLYLEQFGNDNPKQTDFEHLYKIATIEYLLSFPDKIL